MLGWVWVVSRTWVTKYGETITAFIGVYDSKERATRARDAAKAFDERSYRENPTLPKKEYSINGLMFNVCPYCEEF